MPWHNFMFNIAICEDDLSTSNRITSMVHDYQKQHPNTIENVFVFSSSSDLLEHVESKGGFDIYLMDIVMPGVSGIQAAGLLKAGGQNGMVIFLTSSEDFALEAYRVGAMQYLVKPVEAPELFKVLDHALELTARKACKTILVSTIRGRENLPLSSIVYVECRNHILTYHLSDGIALPGRTIRTSFEVAMAPLLAESNFIHPHKSFIINADYVDRLTSQVFVMAGGAEIPITKSRYSQARARYLEYFDLTPGI